MCIEVSISFQSEIKERLNADTLRDREWISQRGKLRWNKRARTSHLRNVEDEQAKMRGGIENEKKETRG